MSNFLTGLNQLDPSVKRHDGGGSSFTLDENGTTQATRLVIGGVEQVPNVDFTVSGTTLSTTSATPSGTNNVVTYQYFKSGNVNTATAVSAGGVNNAAMADDAIGIAELSATGTASSSTFLRGDNAWAAVSTKVVQYKVDHNTAETTGSTIMPGDNTKPQNTEGFEVCSLAITPTSATNKLLFFSNLVGTMTNSNNFVITQALFQDSTADCLAATSCRLTGTENSHPSFLMHYMDAGTTSETTFKIRAGSSFSGTLAVNRSQGGGARYDGTSSGNTLIILELAV